MLNHKGVFLLLEGSASLTSSPKILRNTQVRELPASGLMDSSVAHSRSQ